MKNLYKTILSLCMCSAFMCSVAMAQAPRVIPYPDGLETQIEGASSAPLDINHEDSKYFSQLDYYNMESNNNLTILSHYPTYQQTTEYTCGPAAGLTVLYYFGDTQYDEMSLAQEMKTQGYPIGTNPQDMVDFFKRIGYHTESSLDGITFDSYAAFRDFVLSELKNNHPIMVENVEWGGHWRVIIGYDDMGTEATLDDVLIFADSYDTCDHLQDGYMVGSGWKFYSMWFDHYMLPEAQRNQPFIVAYPED